MTVQFGRSAPAILGTVLVRSHAVLQKALLPAPSRGGCGNERELNGEVNSLVQFQARGQLIFPSSNLDQGLRLLP